MFDPNLDGFALSLNSSSIFSSHHNAARDSVVFDSSKTWTKFYLNEWLWGHYTERADWEESEWMNLRSKWVSLNAWYLIPASMTKSKPFCCFDSLAHSQITLAPVFSRLSPFPLPSPLPSFDFCLLYNILFKQSSYSHQNPRTLWVIFWSHFYSIHSQRRTPTSSFLFLLSASFLHSHSTIHLHQTPFSSTTGWFLCRLSDNKQLCSISTNVLRRVGSPSSLTLFNGFLSPVWSSASVPMWPVPPCLCLLSHSERENVG